MYTHHKVDHEFPGAVDTRLSYMVCAIPRSGSSLLCELLCNTEVAGAPTEFLDPELMGRFHERWGATSFEDYIAKLLRKKTSPNGVFGIKVHWGQLHPALGASDPADVFPGLRYIHMLREDRLRQAVSWVRALQTNQWASSHPALREPEFDREQIEFYVDQIRKEDAAWEEFFAARSITPYRVDYERLVEDPLPTVRAVLEFLGVPDPGAPESGPITLELEQQADALTDQWVERYTSYT